MPLPEMQKLQPNDQNREPQLSIRNIIANGEKAWASIF
jgi:hypothetical protein